MTPRKYLDLDAATDDLLGYHDPNRGSKGLNSRCSLCGAPSVTDQKGWQRCEECVCLDLADIEWNLAGEGGV